MRQRHEVKKSESSKDDDDDDEEEEQDGQNEEEEDEEEQKQRQNKQKLRPSLASARRKEERGEDLGENSSPSAIRLGALTAGAMQASEPSNGSNL